MCTSRQLHHEDNWQEQQGLLALEQQQQPLVASSGVGRGPACGWLRMLWLALSWRCDGDASGAPGQAAAVACYITAY
jgi:hypothetical protein